MFYSLTLKIIVLEILSMLSVSFVAQYFSGFYEPKSLGLVA